MMKEANENHVGRDHSLKVLNFKQSERPDLYYGALSGISGKNMQN